MWSLRLVVAVLLSALLLSALVIGMAPRVWGMLNAHDEVPISLYEVGGFTGLAERSVLIDANGRSVGVRGCIDNRQQQLRPGMFARVNAVFGARPSALVIPEEAIVPQGGRTFVVKVVPGDKPDTLVSQRVAVKLGLRQPGKPPLLKLQDHHFQIPGRGCFSADLCRRVV